MEVDMRKAGIISGSVLSIVALFTLFLPLFRSDPGPWSGVARAETAQAGVNTLQTQMNANTKTLLFLQQGFWMNETINSQELLRRNPNNTAAQKQLINAQIQIERLKIELAK